MDFLLDQLKLLGLNDKEVRVFTALATFGRMNMTKLAARSTLPRTTVDAIVRRMRTQGLVVQEKIKGHYEYRVVLPELVGRLEVLKAKLQPSPQTESGVIPQEEQAQLQQTPDTQFKLETLLEQHVGDRVKGLVVRTHNDMQATLKRFVAMHTLAARYELKLETLVCRALLRDNKEMLRVLLQGVVLAGQHAHVVPEAYCAGHHDMLLLRDSAVLSDPVHGGATHVTDSAVVTSMNHLFAMASETGWRVDLHDWTK